MHDDIGAHGVLFAGLDSVAVHTGGLPAVRLLTAVLFGDDGDLFGHHEGGVEAHAELADNVGVGSLLALQLALELEAAAVGDDAQIVLQIVLVHADAVVADGQGAAVGIGGQEDAEVLPV